MKYIFYSKEYSVVKNSFKKLFKKCFEISLEDYGNSDVIDNSDIISALKKDMVEILIDNDSWNKTISYETHSHYNGNLDHNEFNIINENYPDKFIKEEKILYENGSLNRMKYVIDLNYIVFVFDSTSGLQEMINHFLDEAVINN